MIARTLLALFLGLRASNGPELGGSPELRVGQTDRRVMNASHRAVQAAAKDVLATLPRMITPDSTEKTLAAVCRDLLASTGYSDTWYHDCPALVLLGGRSCASMSGRDYVPSELPVGDFNLVTVDLSPCLGPLWGDCARSFCVEDGVVVDNPKDHELSRGVRVQARLHESLLRTSDAHTRLTDIADMATAILDQEGFENLDFLKNFGHSIAKTLDERVWVERGNTATVADVRLFTFEPHIRLAGGRWGFKHENIYFVNDAGALEAL